MSVSRRGALMAVAGFALAGSPAPAQQTSPKPADAFGEEVTLTPRTVVLAKGSGSWDSAFDTLVGSFKAVLEVLQKQNLRASGAPVTIYTSSDPTNFEYLAGFPVAEEPKGPLPPDISVGKSPEGRALKFIHRGSYDVIDGTYDAITHFVEEKKIETKDVFVEQYVTNPLTTPEDDLVIEIYFLIK